MSACSFFRSAFCLGFLRLLAEFLAALFIRRCLTGIFLSSVRHIGICPSRVPLGRCRIFFPQLTPSSPLLPCSLCVSLCAANVVATPALSAHRTLRSSSHLQPPHGKQHCTAPGSDNCARERGVSAERSRGRAERRRSMCHPHHQTHRLPARRPPALHERYPHPEEMEMDIDIEGNDAPRLRALSSSSLSAGMTPHRLVSPPSFAASLSR